MFGEFSPIEILFFGQFLLMKEAAQILGLLSPRMQLCISYFEQKWVLLHFGRLFSQTHLVTLVGAYVRSYKATEISVDAI
jgi:hypothetical protein